VRLDPAYPVEWTSEQPGMQGGTPLTGFALAEAQFLWDKARLSALDLVEAYIAAHPEPSERLHKSLLNRLLEPYFWHTICVTATEWDGWNYQRCSPLAQPEIRVLAELMRDAHDASTPRELGFGEWHLPYVNEEDIVEADFRGIDIRGISAARCARTSYLTQEGVRDLSKDVELFERLCNPGDGPPHASPLEHVATPYGFMREAGLVWEQFAYRFPGVAVRNLGNFSGWSQLRHEIFPNF
jgi:hypothetical protein